MATLNSTPPSAEAALAQAREENRTKFGLPLERLAKRRGALANEQNSKVTRLREISPQPGSHGIFVDPADRDGALRDERVNLGDRLKAIEVEITRIDTERRELEAGAKESANQIAALEYDAAVGEGKSAVAYLVESAIGLRERCTAARIVIERLQADYPAHQFLPNSILLRAHAGMPPILSWLRTLPEALHNLLNGVAEWDAAMVPLGDPARDRAEHIAAVEAHAAAAGIEAQRRMAVASRKPNAPEPFPRRPSDLEMIAELNAQAAARNHGHAK